MKVCIGNVKSTGKRCTFKAKIDDWCEKHLPKNYVPLEVARVSEVKPINEIKLYNGEISVGGFAKLSIGRRNNKNDCIIFEMNHDRETTRMRI